MIMSVGLRPAGTGPAPTYHSAILACHSRKSIPRTRWEQLSIRLRHRLTRVLFSQLVQHPHDVLQVPVHGPGVRGRARNQPVAVMLGGHTAVRRGALQLGCDRVEFLSGLIARICHESSFR